MDVDSFLVIRYDEIYENGAGELIMENNYRRKKVLLWSFGSDEWEACCEVLGQFFEGEEIEIIKTSFAAYEAGLHTDYSQVDLALVTSSEWYYFVKGMLPEHVPVLCLKYTITREHFGKIEEVSRSETVSVAGETAWHAAYQLRLLEGLGLPEKAMKVWSPGLPEEELCRMVLIAGQAGLKETKEHEYLNFYGHGVPSTDSLVQIAMRLEMGRLLQKDFYKIYDSCVMPSESPMMESIGIGQCYAASMKKAVNGVMCFLPGDRISYYDYNAASLLHVSALELVGKRLADVFPFLKEYAGQPQEFGEQVVRFNERDLIFDLCIFPSRDSFIGYIFISDYKQDCERELRLRTKVLQKVHAAKDTFETICGNSASIEKCLEKARKFAHSQASVLLIGPAGSGKGMFASAIHNGSMCSQGPFITVHCGTLNGMQLERELFGYEGGAFSGASKEGKQGLLELAHMGTLFLDEIGELPLELQKKLIWVLQEKKVVRIGGKGAIPVDFRVIAATHRDLKRMVKENRFYKDLYYHLNVLTLELPGLDACKEEILPLFGHICRKKGYLFELAPEAVKCIQEHQYKGNMQELCNCIEYLRSLEKPVIALEDLPVYMQAEEERDSNLYRSADKEKMEDRKKREESPINAMDPFIQEAIIRNTESQKQIVLDAIQELRKGGKAAGRRSICKKLQEDGCYLSEMQIRKVLELLQEEHKVIIGKGRTGVWLP
ncbi:sigma 54-interacting transcriptional regulator [Lachnospiraceae bacterium 62-35]